MGCDREEAPRGRSPLLLSGLVSDPVAVSLSADAEDDEDDDGGGTDSSDGLDEDDDDDPFASLARCLATPLSSSATSGYSFSKILRFLRDNACNSTTVTALILALRIPPIMHPISPK